MRPRPRGIPRPKHIWSKIDPKEAFTKFRNTAPVIGAGPFQVVEWKRGDHVRMKANRNYWGAAPTVDELLFTYLTNPPRWSSTR